MITLIEARNFRALRYVRQELKRFQVLTGPNASGKTTFMDVLSFLSELVAVGPSSAIERRAQTFDDLLTDHHGNEFELAVEARIPDELRRKTSHPQFDTIRYEIRIGRAEDAGPFGILFEAAYLTNPLKSPTPEEFGELFPRDTLPPQSISGRPHGRKSKLVLKKNPHGNDNFYTEVGQQRGGGWLPSFKFGPLKSALANLPDDGTRFPVSLWFRDYLANQVQRLVLDSLQMRLASPPGQSKGFKLDGSNLPWVIRDLATESREAFSRWIDHLQTALPDLETVSTVEREDDKHLYLVAKYRGGLEVPSWMISDGTLRLLALTLPAYLPNLQGVFLIEEPENGVHPKAVETVVQSLSSVYGAQVLLATHSPVIISAVDVSDILCFQKSDSGATDIVPGSAHPALRDWKGETNLGVLFASGILG